MDSSLTSATIWSGKNKPRSKPWAGVPSSGNQISRQGLAGNGASRVRGSQSRSPGLKLRQVPPVRDSARRSATPWQPSSRGRGGGIVLDRPPGTATLHTPSPQPSQRAGAAQGQGSACALAFPLDQLSPRRGGGGSWAPRDGRPQEQAAARAPRLVWAAGKLLMGIQEGDLWLAAEITKRACPAAAQAVDAAIGLAPGGSR